MNREQLSSEAATPATLESLFRRYLQKQVTAQGLGLGLGLPDVAGLVEAYDAVPVRPVDPELAWNDARQVACHFPELAQEQWEVPPVWAMVVAAQEPAIDLALCLGNFPQMVRHLQPLLSGEDLGKLCREQPQGRPLEVAECLQWAQQTNTRTRRLLAYAVGRLARQFPQASDILTQLVSDCRTPGWQTLLANEQAALAWHRGDREEALGQWRTQEESVPVLFNRGMAGLFLGDRAEAHSSLSRAALALPESGPWHHLGQLYLALV
jgi:hypothetical protein